MVHISGLAKLIREYDIPEEDDHLGSSIVLDNVMTMVS